MDNASQISTTPAYGEYDHQPASRLPEDTRELIAILIIIPFGACFCLVGVVANVLNIIVFYRQGPMSSSPTVILTVLAVADLTVCTFGLVSTCFVITEIFIVPDFFAWWVQNNRIIYTGRPLNMVTQFTCLVTTFLSFERAVSVTFPFKVKAVFTPRRSPAVVAVIFVLLFIVHLPNLTNVLYHRYIGYPEPNDTIWIFVRNTFWSKRFHEVYFTVSPIFLRFSTVFIVAICNGIIVWKVKSSQRFRKSKASGSGTPADEVTSSKTHDNINNTQPGLREKTKTSKGDNPPSKDTKDLKLLRMIATVSVIFTVCYFLNIIYIIIFYLIWTVNVHFHPTLENAVYDSSLVLQYFNSCINTVVYYRMSSRYKEELQSLCGKKGSIIN